MNKKQIMSLWVGGFSAAALLLVVFLVYPLLSDIQKGSSEILLARASMVTAELEARELARFEKNYKNYQPNFEQADALRVDAKDPINFIKFLERTGVESGVVVEIKLVPIQGQLLATWPASVFSVQVGGSFSGVMTFTKKLETGPYLTGIYKLSIQKTQDIADDKSKSTASVIEADMLIRVATK